MAMTRIRVGFAPDSRFMVGIAPMPKVKDPETGEIATDRETGKTLYTVTLFLTEEGRAEMLKLTVPQGGFPEDLAPGMQVEPVELFATPWARMFNGQVSDGVAYRAAALKLSGATGGQAPKDKAA
ncbi:hypothetical protein [Streptomyces sp. CA-132043]|uniref:SCO3933 family regulatory protein n=1 Tax=Streptomyces sp. CA-132043 TaxID=3240048 RepID=UPI003D9044EF